MAVDLMSRLKALNAEHASWERRMRGGQTVAQKAYNRMFAEAHDIRFFETMVVPGLLQTAPYARRVLAEARTTAGLEMDDVDDAVAARTQRQQILYDSEKRFEFLLAESVLYWRVGPAVVMKPQLDRLQTVIGLPNARFGIFPFEAAQAAFPQNAFQICDDVALVETFTGETTYRGAEAQTSAAVLDRLWSHAIEGEAAREVIARAAR